MAHPDPSFLSLVEFVGSHMLVDQLHFEILFYYRLGL
jgi:hypothetical protein